MENRNTVTLFVFLLITGYLAGCAAPKTKTPETDSTVPQEATGWQEEFGLDDCSLTDKGQNDFFILAPGFQITLEGGGDKVVITVLDETRQIEGFSTRIVEEKEWKSGDLVEISRNYYALCEETKDVFYFGEEVDMYKDGDIVNHFGAWLHGENGAKAGLIMPGTPTVGMKYFQEIAPGVAMDRAEITSIDGVLETPAGSFKEALIIREGTALNSLEVEYKTYVRDIGLIEDAYLLVTNYGFVKLP